MTNKRYGFTFLYTKINVLKNIVGFIIGKPNVFEFDFPFYQSWVICINS